MDVLIITVFASLMLVVAGLVLFVHRLKAGDFEHGDRLSLLPLDDEDELVSVRQPSSEQEGDVNMRHPRAD